MKILLRERQIQMIVEQTDNVDVFTNKIIEKFFRDDLDGDYKEFKSLLITSIELSGCKKINFGQFRYPANGVASGDKVVINKKVLDTSMGDLLYVIFHEIAHQYQYKKYGEDKIYKIYTGEIGIMEGIDIIRNLETVADEYGIRKVREFIKRGFVKENDLPTSIYKSVSNQMLGLIINQMKSIVNKLTDKSKESVSLHLYNFVVSKIS